MTITIFIISLSLKLRFTQQFNQLLTYLKSQELYGKAALYQFPRTANFLLREVFFHIILFSRLSFSHLLNTKF